MNGDTVIDLSKSARLWQIGVVGVALLLMVGFLLTRNSSVSAGPLPTVDPTLTGPAVAQQLGIEGTADPKAEFECQTIAAADQEGTRYCLDSLASDPVQQMVISYQIGGLPATPTRVEYVKAFLEVSEARLTLDADDPALYELEAKARSLQLALADETAPAKD